MQEKDNVTSLYDYKKQKIVQQNGRITFLERLQLFYREFRNRLINYLLIKKGRGPLTPSENVTRVIGGDNVTSFEAKGVIANMNASPDLVQEGYKFIDGVFEEKKMESQSTQSNEIGGMVREKYLKSALPFIRPDETNKVSNIKYSGNNNNSNSNAA